MAAKPFIKLYDWVDHTAKLHVLFCFAQFWTIIQVICKVMNHHYNASLKLGCTWKQFQDSKTGILVSVYALARVGFLLQEKTTAEQYCFSHTCHACIVWCGGLQPVNVFCHQCVFYKSKL